MASNPLQGKRYINLLRASTNMQDTSVADQKAVNDRHAQEKLGMIWAGDVELQGVSGSKTFNRRDLKGLLERRRAFKNYDVIVVYDSSRLTRGGPRHSFTVRTDFAREGVLIISVCDPVPEGDFKEVIQTVIDVQNHLLSKKISGFVTRGINDAVKRGSVEKHGGGCPIGVHRQYLDVSGKPKLRLRYLPGGVRELINENTGETEARYLRGQRDTAAYLLAIGEKVRLVPGDPKVIAAIREAFRMRYRDGIGFTRIANYFVSQGIKPMRTQAWTAGAIRDIVMNPLYLGWSYFRMYKSGLFHCADDGQPQARDIDQDKLEKENRECVPRDRRAVEDMMIVQHPELAGYIEDDDVRIAAEAVIRNYYKDWHLRKTRPVLENHNNQAKSRFFLKNVLIDKHHNRKFCGLTHGRDGTYRDYICNPVVQMDPAAPKLFMGVTAQPLESSCIDVLKHAFSVDEQIEQRIEQYVQQAVAEQPSEMEKASLQADIDAIKERTRQMQRSFNAEELRENDDLIRELRSERLRLEQRLNAAQASSQLDPKRLVADIRTELASFDSNLNGDCYEKLRALVNFVCPRIEVDLATFEVVITIALPKQILYARTTDWRMMCDPYVGEVSNARDAHQEHCLNLATYWLAPAIQPPRSPQIALKRPRRPVYTTFEWMRTDEPSNRKAA